MIRKLKQWYKGLTDAGVEVRRNDDPSKDELLAPMKSYTEIAEENKERIEKTLKENNFDEKLKQSRENGNNRIALYYDVLKLPNNVKYLEFELLSYLTEEVEGFVVIESVKDFSTEKSRINIVLKSQGE